MQGNAMATRADAVSLGVVGVMWGGVITDPQHNEQEPLGATALGGF